MSNLVNIISPGFFDVKIKVDENLPSFFEALEKGDKEWMLMEERNLRKNYVLSIKNILTITLEREVVA